MSLLAASAINLKRNRVVKWVNAYGESQNAVIRAVTGGGTTLTLWIPGEKRTITGVAKATTPRGPGFHYRSTV
jgi:hypothetical protein